MEVILRKDVESLGEPGDVVNVKPGYARNYLLPQGLAYEATPGNRRRLEEEQHRAARSLEREWEAAERLAVEVTGRSVTFSMRAGEGGRLFGSVTASDIAHKLEEDGIKVDRHTIRLPEPIKQLGAYSVEIHLHRDVRPEIRVWVVPEA